MYTFQYKSLFFFPTNIAAHYFKLHGFSIDAECNLI